MRAVAQTAPASVCVSWSTAGVATSSAASSTADSNAPSCGLRGWDKGTNIGYYVGSQYASFNSCNALCNNQVACLSFTYLASGPYCIIYDYLVEGNMTPDSGSPYAFFDKGGVCAGTVAATSAATTSSSSLSTSSSPSLSSSLSSSSPSSSSSLSSSSSSSQPSTTRTSSTVATSTTSSRTSSTLSTSSTTPSSTRFTTLFSSTTTYSTSTYTTSTCTAGLVLCLGYSTFTTTTLVPMTTSVAYTTKPV